MPKLIVVGGSSYIGQNLLDSFDASFEFDVVPISRHGLGNSFDLAVEQSLDMVSRSVVSGDVVVLLASVSAPDLCARDPEYAWNVNVRNTKELIARLSEQGVRIIFASSDVVFGGFGSRAYDDSERAPIGVYGEMKAEVEKFVEGNSQVKVVRFSYVLGKGDKYSQMLIEKTQLRESIDVFSGFQRNVVSIDDVTQGIKDLASSWDQQSDQFYNFSGPQLIGRAELTEALAQVIDGLDFTVIKAPEGFWAQRAKVIETDCTNFTRLLGRPPRDLQQIISEWTIK